MLNSIKISTIVVVIILISNISINGQLPFEEIPENIGMSSERLNRISVAIEDFVSQNKIAVLWL